MTPFTRGLTNERQRFTKDSMRMNDISSLRRHAGSAAFREWAAGLLVKLMRYDTTPGHDLNRMARNEAAVFQHLVNAALEAGCSGETIRHVPISQAIAAHAYYTPPYYAPAGTPRAYEGRGNLVISLRFGAGAARVAINSHIDTVSPFLPPSRTGDIVRGRGAADDKGGCVTALGALRLIQELSRQGISPAAGQVEFQFVIDEEPGGNGTLSLALGSREAFDAVIVIEPTGLQIHPGNRGALWYKLELDTLGHAGISAAEMALAAVAELEEEGKRIREESRHPLFPSRPVQANPGILGPFGGHPSAVCDHVALLVQSPEHPTGAELVTRRARSALRDYCAAHGDKTVEADAATSRPRLAEHFLVEGRGEGILLHIYGISGHMGRLCECDNAITKAACIARALASDARITFAGKHSGERRCALEGGQGFLPTHGMSAIKRRLAGAAIEGVRAFVERRAQRFAPSMARMTFDKLHNEAFACDPKAAPVAALSSAARSVGIEVPEPLVGLPASSDARIFAHLFPESTVLTFGPGELRHAHSTDEQVPLEGIVRAAAAVAGFVLGTGMPDKL